MGTNKIPEQDTQAIGRLFDNINLITKNSIDKAIEQIYNRIQDHLTGGQPNIELIEDLIIFPDTRFNGTGLYNIEPKASNRWRYSVGIENISSENVKYKQRGEIITKSQYIGRPIRLVSLDVHEFIPPEFYEIDPDYEWIKYFISVDEGSTFFAIAPSNKPDRFFDDDPTTRIPKILNINSGVPKDSRPSYSGKDRAFIDVSYQVYKVKLKILMERPSENFGPDRNISPDIFSPQINSYTIKIIPHDTGGSL